MSETFELLIEANSGRIRSIARRYANPDEVDDLCQEISLALWRSFARFRSESSVETWLYRIAFNTAMTRVRKTVHERKKIETLRASQLNNDSTPDGFSQADILENFLDSLNDIDATVLMMYLDGLTTDAMKQVLGISGNAINVRVNRIKDRFNTTYVDER
ncbi:MAG: sigma-70 family RNA polymerase sigma factor [bacterium]|nr:sigma-70 family RNA polymerase sigma factor [Gammaproteobacteria bacterium]HIL97991.1 sigma-70 family RNA polymerase sigma factor [Pseudomonadales bacterium]